MKNLVLTLLGLLLVCGLQAQAQRSSATAQPPSSKEVQAIPQVETSSPAALPSAPAVRPSLRPTPLQRMQARLYVAEQSLLRAEAAKSGAETTSGCDAASAENLRRQIADLENRIQQLQENQSGQ